MPSVPGVPFFGNFKDIVRGRQCLANMFRDIYDTERFQSSPVVGFEMFHTPALFVRDPELAKLVLIKDFASFSERWK